MTKKEESVEHRILAAETLAYLIEVSAHLQRVAAISNHLISSMASFLSWADRQEGNANNGISNGNNNNNNNNGNVILAGAQRPPEPPSLLGSPTTSNTGTASTSTPPRLNLTISRFMMPPT